MKTVNIILSSIFLTFSLIAVGIIATAAPTLALMCLKLIFGFGWEFVFIPSFIIVFIVGIKSYFQIMKK